MPRESVGIYWSSIGYRNHHSQLSLTFAGFLWGRWWWWGWRRPRTIRRRPWPWSPRSNATLRWSRFSVRILRHLLRWRRQRGFPFCWRPRPAWTGSRPWPWVAGARGRTAGWVPGSGFVSDASVWHRRVNGWRLPSCCTTVICIKLSRGQQGVTWQHGLWWWRGRWIRGALHVHLWQKSPDPGCQHTDPTMPQNMSTHPSKKYPYTKIQKHLYLFKTTALWYHYANVPMQLNQLHMWPSHEDGDSVWILTIFYQFCFADVTISCQWPRDLARLNNGWKFAIAL